jgi:hypothetical protein
MSTHKYTSVWDALEPDAESAAQMKARATLMTAVRDRTLVAMATAAGLKVEIKIRRVA